MNRDKAIDMLDTLKAAVRADPSSVGVLGPQLRNMVSAVRRLPGGIATPGGTTGVVQCAGHCHGHCHAHCVSHPTGDITIEASTPV